MRSEGMEKWHVWNIFTALPLLLQAALALFLIGIVDFLLALDNEVAIPISVIVGLTLLFLAATTALPTLQGVYLYLPFLFVRDLSKEPSQCPYKSPQSHVFRAFFSFGFYLFHHIIPPLRPACGYLYSRFLYAIQYLHSVFTSISQWLAKRPWSASEDIEHQDNPVDEIHDNISTDGTDTYNYEGHQTEDHHVIPLILTTWRTKRWVDFDSAWLLLRDACANGVHDQNSGLSEHRLDSNNHEILPLFDSVQAIQEAVRGTNPSHTDPFHLSAIYHSFSELSKLLVEWRSGGQDTAMFHRGNRFFYALWKGSDFLKYEDEYQLISHSWWASMKDLHCQNMKLFVTSSNIFNTPAQSLDKHLAELNILLFNCWGKTHPINLISSNSSPPLPRSLQFRYSATKWNQSKWLSSGLNPPIYTDT
ncbi:hypothetical protein GALMADRAFT_1146822 [Galerina marginata CBS 339.88]|uniref:DUF6535 domain-containing protein n=1 Tax=Galerina marginata (strain CBS 339.88) TaxID=685588 RepID=A0A067SFT1_GALM3|nr:hypothetical protein GALMADRAFT_1146822 [Galerina marginata CBS 339.88]